MSKCSKFSQCFDKPATPPSPCTLTQTDTLEYLKKATTVFLEKRGGTPQDENPGWAACDFAEEYEVETDRKYGSLFVACIRDLLRFLDTRTQHWNNDVEVPGGLVGFSG